MIRLIVKGDKHAAAKAAAEHGVPFVFVREVKILGTRTVGMVADVHRDKLYPWFAEADKAPYPEGSLLLFSKVEES